MKMTGNQRIAASKQRVWEALNDPEVLKQCIPGCQSLEKDGDDRFRATAVIKIGPMDARFSGAVRLADIDPPNGYTISGEGQGGAAGFAKGNAKIELAEDSGATILSYEVDAQVGGRLAQLGGPIIDATAKQLAGGFFKKFGDIVAPPPAATPAVAGASKVTAAARAPGASTPFALGSGFPVAWALAVVVAALAGFLLGRPAPSEAGLEWAAVVLGLLVVIVAAAGFEFGRRSAAPVIVLDPALLDHLVRQGREKH